MRWFIAALVVVALLLQYRIWGSPDGMREVLRLEAAVEAQREENRRLEARNRQLAAEVRDLKQGFAAIEERARSELGLIGPNETYFQVVPRDKPARNEALEEEQQPLLDQPSSTALAAAR